jgi:hypothetical protein
MVRMKVKTGGGTCSDSGSDKMIGMTNDYYIKK